MENHFPDALKALGDMDSARRQWAIRRATHSALESLAWLREASSEVARLETEEAAERARLEAEGAHPPTTQA